MGHDSVIGIATHCKLDGPWIKTQSGEIFHTHPQWLEGPPSPLYNAYRIFAQKKAVRVWHWQPHLAERLQKEYSYTCNHPLSLHDL
jgi:hypothetical protein